MKYITTILTILGLYLIILGCSPKQDCTDDGCDDFGVDEITIPPILEGEEIRGELQLEPKIITVNHIVNTNAGKDVFVYSLSNCIDHIYKDVAIEQRIPKELIIAQAALETGWGKSRFANEGNNLFGIRTFNKDEDWLLPITWDQEKWIGWGVKVYETKCDSVRDYVRILNEVWAYEDFREVRQNGGNVYQLADTLTKYASKPTYTKLVKNIIKHNIVGVYEL